MLSRKMSCPSFKEQLARLGTYCVRNLFQQAEGFEIVNWNSHAPMPVFLEEFSLNGPLFEKNLK